MGSLGDSMGRGLFSSFSEGDGVFGLEIQILYLVLCGIDGRIWDLWDGA